MVENKTERLQLLVEPSLVKEIDDFRFSNRIASRAKAMRRLIELGLMELNETQKADAQA